MRRRNEHGRLVGLLLTVADWLSDGAISHDAEREREASRIDCAAHAVIYEVLDVAAGCVPPAHSKAGKRVAALAAMPGALELAELYMKRREKARRETRRYRTPVRW